jgi:5-methyltetrahydrofolate--homocysteine methyltransferase
MQRRGLELPLLIGGATTSARHTAIKIAPAYSREVLHVADASRAVDVVGQLLDPARREALGNAARADQQRAREAFAERSRADGLSPFAEARRAGLETDWSREELPRPEFFGCRTLDEVPLSELEPLIDWTPFFHAWELRGVYPRILDDPKFGAAARELFENARSALDGIVREGSLIANGVYGFFPANSDGEDIVLWTDESRGEERVRFPMLRQQHRRSDGKPLLCLADFVAPADSGRVDSVGAFAVTTGIGLDELVAEFERDHDDYGSILAKALSDRLAEAFAEWLHRRVRAEWGYARDENLSVEELIKERYRGIRPAAGYPACPDHSLKPDLFALLDAERAAGISLTENHAMLPTASVSGFYFAHPRSRYFAVGRIGRDQVRDYAARRGVEPREVERWLAPNLDYTPES